jgi:beta-lactamase regulating signal transducer with metallopeptidase domain
MDLDLILRTSLLLAAAAGIARLLNRAAPSTRHLVWNLAIVFTLLAPFIAPLAPQFRVPMVPTVPEGPRVLMVPEVLTVRASNSQEPTRVDDTRTLGTSMRSTLGTLGTIGTLGTLMVSAWFLFCWALSGLSVRYGSKPAPDDWIAEARAVAARAGWTGRLEVRRTLKDGSPHVAGLFRSVVMMPPSAANWSSDERQAAFVHELTHIRRRDRRTQALAQLACAIYWFNPLVWMAAAGLARERERACDDEVLRVGVKPSAYASLLLDLARVPSPMWTPATALSMARPSAIEGRLLMILANVARTPRASSRWLVTAALAGLTVTILGAQPVDAERMQSGAPVQAATPKPIVKNTMLDQHAKENPPVVTSALIDALADSDRQVRERAALGLAFTPGAAVIDALLGALKDSDSQVREKAAIGLAFRRDPRIIEPLLEAMRDEDGQVREKAAIALGASGDARAVDALRTATKDPDPQVREKAVAGLVLLGLRQ